MYPRCAATGKRSLPSVEEARSLMYLFRNAVLNKLTGKRIKHRRGKPVQIRAYPCDYCKGYHLTRWTQQRFKNAPQHNL
ncbi:hypothetical protein [Chryseobacterium viscerum]|uniref:Uncharacterized protein n=1 Tax=Chryseobacterium viscerum TaxID=1037377 RepID=A0A316WSD6_9FLAO|nr:hypothetical protein [Chryseobacterium viscerum]PWN64127.1 hypothetical protein C1634_005915 [Chryseobacterium viscerum]